MSRTYGNEKNSSQSTTSFQTTASFLQTRGFAPIQTDLDENATFRPSGYTENFLEKLINQPSTASSDTPVQAKPMNRLRRPLQDKRVSMIQAKLSIGEPNDNYEQEADTTASKVVQQINSPMQDQSIQRESMEEEEELQMKPISSIQRESMEEEEGLQMKPVSSIQQGAMEEEEELQMKSLVQRQENIGGGEASTDLDSSIQSARGSGQSLDPNLQAKMGEAMGADFSGVKVHTDSQSDQLNKSIQAKAFTTGQDVFFRQGAYEPNSRGGQELIAHELTHVVQQNGSAVQRMASSNHFSTSFMINRYTQMDIGGDDTRVADDATAAVTQQAAEGGQEMYAEESAIAEGQKKLKEVKSGIELVTTPGLMTLEDPKDKSEKTLKNVWPKNKQNKTGGIKKPSLKDKIKAKVSGKPAPEPLLKIMKLWADCGKSNGVVIGGSSRRAVFEAQTDDTVEKTETGGPSKMKAQVLMKVLSEVADKWEIEAKDMEEDDPDRQGSIDFIKEIREEEEWTKNEWSVVTNMIKTATTDDDWKKVRNKYDEIADHVLTMYTSWGENNQDIWSERAGINEYANPDIGQGFTISSGGAELSDNTWNFHWAGVVLKSADGADSVTLENYAVGDASEENAEWVFQMYGHSKKKQSFHHQHKRSKLHGETPTTMVVESVPTKK
jgi:hypothetical protein